MGQANKRGTREERINRARAEGRAKGDSPVPTPERTTDPNEIDWPTIRDIEAIEVYLQATGDGWNPPEDVLSSLKRLKEAFVRRAKINTDQRLFDLVRFMRAELHEAGLISFEEYTWLLAGSVMAKGGGSPSPRRLESYDQMKAELEQLRPLIKLLPKCPKCEAPMADGLAIEQTYTGIPDFASDTHPTTISPGGSGILIECLKCVGCGHSVTK